MNALLFSLVVAAAQVVSLPDGFLLIAHRGVVDTGHGENSLPALEAAVARGYTHIEVDIRGTKDGYPVCLHDDSLLRTAGVDKRVGELSLAALRALADEATVPSLDAFCAAASGKIQLMPDMKACPIAMKQVFLERVDAILTRRDLLREALFIGRLDFAAPFEGRARIAWRVSLDRARAQLDSGVAKVERRFIFNHGDDFTAEDVAGFQALGLPVIVSINTGHYASGDPIAQGDAHIRAMLALGVDGLQIDSVYDQQLVPRGNTE